jgi:hypothetical protein
MILGLAGKAGAGKDSAALVLSHNYDFKQIAFADNLKTMCKWVFQITQKQCYDQSVKEKKFATPIELSPEHIERILDYAYRINGFEVTTQQRYMMYKYVGNLTTLRTPRELLQFVGTELLREIIDEDYHVKVVKNKIDQDEDTCSTYVITDARFENERSKIKEWGGYTAIVDRESDKGAVGLAGHASENNMGSFDDYDFVINNNGSLDDLPKEIDKLVDSINNL